MLLDDIDLISIFVAKSLCIFDNFINTVKQYARISFQIKLDKCCPLSLIKKLLLRFQGCQIRVAGPVSSSHNCISAVAVWRGAPLFLFVPRQGVVS